MSDCLFCKIIKGEIPSYKVYEDDDVVAFLDITPVNSGHTLVVPKEHYEDMTKIPDELLCKVIRVIKHVAPAALKAVGSTGFNLGQNNGKVAGPMVDHVHFHITPRFEGDGYELWTGRAYSDGEAEEVLKQIVGNLK
jgi:histidine triad (HIT) family protein